MKILNKRFHICIGAVISKEIEQNLLLRQVVSMNLALKFEYLPENESYISSDKNMFIIRTFGYMGIKNIEVTTTLSQEKTKPYASSGFIA